MIYFIREINPRYVGESTHAITDFIAKKESGWHPSFDSCYNNYNGYAMEQETTGYSIREYLHYIEDSSENSTLKVIAQGQSLEEIKKSNPELFI